VLRLFGEVRIVVRMTAVYQREEQLVSGVLLAPFEGRYSLRKEVTGGLHHR
jgi:hypothetical protein